MVGQNDDDHFGDNVLTGEDINGDGFNDVVVSALNRIPMVLTRYLYLLWFVRISTSSADSNGK